MLRLFSAAAALIIVLSACVSNLQGGENPSSEIALELLEPVSGPVYISVEAVDGSTASRRLVREVRSRLLRERRSGQKSDDGGTSLNLTLGADLRTRDSKSGGMLSRGYQLTVSGELTSGDGRRTALISGRVERSYSRFLLDPPGEQDSDGLLATWDERFYRRVARAVYQELDSIYKKQYIY